MLIDWEKNELNQNEFKQQFKEIDWVKVTRKIGTAEEIWYTGHYEDDKKKVKAVVRPSLRMQLTETFKNMLANGTSPKKGQKPTKTSPFVEYGSTVQVLVDSNFISEVEKIAKEPTKKKIQKISW